MTPPRSARTAAPEGESREGLEHLCFHAFFIFQTFAELYAENLQKKKGDLVKANS